MKLSESEFSPGLPIAPDQRTPPHSQAFQWACLIGLILAGGCSSLDGNNTDTKPWDRQTKADMSQGWLLTGEGWGPSGSHYP